MISFRSPAATSFSLLTVHVSTDPISGFHDQTGDVIAWSVRAELALLDWIPVIGRLCTILLDGSMLVNTGLLVVLIS